MEYDAFISYSHAADGRLAPAVQTGLQRLARPWYRVRALRAFRDESGLAVNPHLWASIADALDNSRYFVLMVSPAAAASPWVNREIDHWFASKPPDSVLPVLTDGELVWDDDLGDYDSLASTALPPAMLGRFTDEPRHLDLRWARDETQLDLRHGRFRESIAALAAPIHGMAKDELESEDVRSHRRTLRLARSAVIALALLAVSATTAGAFAVGNARRANAAAHHARASADEAAVSVGREAAARRDAQAQATNAKRSADGERSARQNAQEAAANADVANQSAQAEAARARDALARAETAAENARSSEAERAAAAAHATVEARRADAEAAKAQVSANEAQVAANLARRQAVAANAARQDAQNALADAKRQAEEATRQQEAAIARGLSASSLIALGQERPDLALLLGLEGLYRSGLSNGAASDVAARGNLLAGLVSDPALETLLHGNIDAQGIGTAFNLDGSRLAIGGLAPASGGLVQVWDVEARRLIATSPPNRDDAPPKPERRAVTNVTFSSTGLLAWGTNEGTVETWNYETGSLVELSDRRQSVSAPALVSFSGDGKLLAAATSHGFEPTLRVWNVRTGDLVFRVQDPDGWSTMAVAMNRAGSELVVSHRTGDAGAAVDRISVWDVPTQRLIATFDGHSFNPDSGDLLAEPLLAFGENDASILSVASGASDGVFGEWATPSGERLRASPLSAGELLEPVVAVSLPDEVVATRAFPTGAITVRHFDGSLVGKSLAPSPPFLQYPPLAPAIFSPDGSTLAAPSAEGTVRLFNWKKLQLPDPRLRTSTPLPQGHETDYRQISPDGRSVILTASTGAVLVLSAENGAPYAQQPHPRLARNYSYPEPVLPQFSADSGSIATFEIDGTVKAWDVISGRQLYSVQPPSWCVPGLSHWALRQRGDEARLSMVCLQLNHAGNVASSRLVNWRIDARIATKSFEMAMDVPVETTISPDLKSIAVAGVRLELRDSLTGGLQVASEDLALRSPEFSDDGTTIVASDYPGGIGIFEAATLDRRLTIPGPPTFSLNRAGDILATYDGFGVVKLWDVSRGEDFGKPLIGASGGLAVHGIAFNAAGDELLTVGDAIVRHDLRLEHWISMACRIANRNLTRSEWHQYVGGSRAYRKQCVDLP